MQIPGLRSSALAALLAMATLANAAPPRLVQALKNGDRTTALALSRQHDEAVAAEADGTTALHWAVRQSDGEVVERLLKAGADVKAANRYGVTAIHLAATNGDPALLRRLLDAGADVNTLGADGETPLMTVARGGHLEAAKLLMERGANVEAREAWHGQTALMWAAAQGHAAMITELLAHGAKVNERSSVEHWDRQTTAEPREKWLPPGGLTPLLFAAREGQTVKSGADVNATTPHGISGIVLALINGHYDTAGALIEAGTNANLADNTGRTALYAAIDFSTMPNSNRPAPKVLENRLSALDVARLLLDHGADVNARLTALPPYRAKLDRGNDTMFQAGTTALLRAAKAADLPAIELLIEHGADARLGTNRVGITPLLAAAGVGTNESDSTGRQKTQADAIGALKIFLDHGVDVNSPDNNGRTALHGAALQGYNDVIRFLATKGASLDAKDNKGFTPLDVALGKAGGFGFAGSEGVRREATADLIRRLVSGTSEDKTAAR
jgi:ankyrin repeat protein